MRGLGAHGLHRLHGFIINIERHGRLGKLFNEHESNESTRIFFT